MPHEIYQLKSAGTGGSADFAAAPDWLVPRKRRRTSPNAPAIRGRSCGTAVPRLDDVVACGRMTMCFNILWHFAKYDVGDRDPAARRRSTNRLAPTGRNCKSTRTASLPRSPGPGQRRLRRGCGRDRGTQLGGRTPATPTPAAVLAGRHGGLSHAAPHRIRRGDRPGHSDARLATARRDVHRGVLRLHGGTAAGTSPSLLPDNPGVPARDGPRRRRGLWQSGRLQRTPSPSPCQSRHREPRAQSETRLAVLLVRHAARLPPDRRGIRRLVPDLVAEPGDLWLHRFFFVPGVVTIVATLLLGGFSAFAIGYCGACLGVIRAGSAINCFGHTRGTRRYETDDTSTNNPVVAILSLGEGWHNDRHFYPAACRAGFE